MQNHPSSIEHPFTIFGLRSPLSVLLSLLCLVIIVSCKENDKTEMTDILLVPKIKAITYHENGAVQSIHSFEYDSLGRCTKFSVYAPATATTTSSTYQYAPGMVLVDRFYNELNYYYHRDTIFLNEQGLEIQTINHSDNRLYDSNGYLIQRTESGLTSVPAIYIYKVLDGNTVRIIQNIITPTEARVFSIKYVTFIPNSVNTIGNENMGMYF